MFNINRSVRARMVMRGVAIISCGCMLMGAVAGCDAVKKKFTRKKKPVTKMPRVHPIKKYDKKPSPELYEKHFIYWVTWSSELIQVLGDNHKKDMRCIEEALMNLKDMQHILVPEKAELLTPHVEALERVRETVKRNELTQYNRDSIRSTLEREDRYVKRDFTLTKMKPYLRTSFEEDE